MDRRTIIQKGAGFGFLGGLIGNGRSVFCADPPNDHRFEGNRSDDKSPVADWHLELTRCVSGIDSLLRQKRFDECASVLRCCSWERAFAPTI